MLIVQKDRLIEILGLHKSGGKGWYVGTCPFCGKQDKFGVIFSEDVTSFNCFSGACRRHGPISTLLRHIGRLDLLYKESLKFVGLEDKLKKIVLTVDTTVLDKVPPIGFKRTYSNAYLNSRGFTPDSYERYVVGTTSFSSEYVYFLILDENEKVKGWVGRSVRPKKEIQEINKRREEDGKDPYLRYQNSPNTDFEKLLGNSNQITEETKVVVLVEGKFDVVNIEKLLNSSPQIVVCCTFGKKASIYQMKILQDKGIQNVIFLWDSVDAINEMKHTANQWSSYFNVKVGYTPVDRDPGDFTIEDLDNVLENLADPFSFSISKVQKKALV